MRSINENINKFKKLNKDYLTFYHEIRTPQHDFFTGESNFDDKSKIIIISSPSRMGNHLLLSMLDNHPDIPRIPGEDGFLLFSFWQANYDLHRFLAKFAYEKDLEYIKKMNTNLAFDKWSRFKECYLKNEIPEKHSGIETLKTPGIIDFQDLVFDINYDEYHKALKKGLKELGPNATFREFLCLYLQAMLHLDFKYEIGKKAYQGFLVASGMRSQVRWLLKHFRNAKAIISLRPFESYALSHVRSRYRIMELDDTLAKEAWEHWYHKVVDYFYLKTLYPNNICLVSYDDVILDTKNTASAIADFLGINFSENMLAATIFGIPVQGNPSIKKNGSEKGLYYFKKEKIPQKYIPLEYYHLWDSFDLIKNK